MQQYYKQLILLIEEVFFYIKIPVCESCSDIHFYKTDNRINRKDRLVFSFR